jgi:hypothetical protein
MSQHRYRVYYEFNGPTKADPLRAEKNKEQIADALESVGFELSVFLDDDSAKITTSKDGERGIVLTIETTQSDVVLARAMHVCLNGLDLRGTKLP